MCLWQTGGAIVGYRGVFAAALASYVLSYFFSETAEGTNTVPGWQGSAVALRVKSACGWILFA